MNRLYAEDKSQVTENFCSFCNAISNGGVTPNFQSLFPDMLPKEQILMETEDWFLVPDDFHLVQDHLLVISKTHKVSCAATENQAKQELKSIVQIVSKHIRAHNKKSTKMFFFEHGSGLIGDNIVAHCGACGSHDHAHFHIIPLEKEVVGFLAHKVQEILNINAHQLTVDQNLPNTYEPYLYLADEQKTFIFYPTEIQACITIPSQFIRKLLGEHLDFSEDEWNYQDLYQLHADLCKKRIINTIETWKLSDRKISDDTEQQIKGTQV